MPVTGTTMGIDGTPVLMEGGSVIWRDLFTPAQLDALEHYCDGLPLEPARCR